MFSSKVHNLRHFGFSDLVSEHPAFADTLLMDVHHNECAVSWSLLKKRSRT